MIRRLSAQQRINIEGRSWNSPVKKRKNFQRSTIYTNNIDGSVEQKIFSHVVQCILTGIVARNVTE